MNDFYYPRTGFDYLRLSIGDRLLLAQELLNGVVAEIACGTGDS